MQTQSFNNPKPWTVPLVQWCSHNNSDAETYKRLVRVAYRGGQLNLGDHDLSDDARWLITQERNFSGRRSS